MRFEAEHRLPAPVGAVIEVLVDPGFHSGLDLPDVDLLEVVEHRDDGSQAVVSLHYQYVGRLDPVVHRLLRGRPLTWVQALAVDRTDHRGAITVTSDASGGRLRVSVDFTFEDEGDETVWMLVGDVRVGVPLVGREAERRIVTGFLERLHIEAQAMAQWLRARP